MEEEPQDVVFLSGASIEFVLKSRVKNEWGMNVVKKYPNGSAVWVDLSYEELCIVKRELDKFTISEFLP